MLLQSLQNAAVLVTAVVFLDRIAGRKQLEGKPLLQAVIGVVTGGICLGLTAHSFPLPSHIVHGGQSVLLSLSGLLVGAIPTVVAMFIASTSQALQGGSDAWGSIAVVAVSGGLGIVWRSYRSGQFEDPSARELLGFGLTIHLVVLTLAALLVGPGWASAPEVFSPELIAMPAVALVLGTFLVVQLRRVAAAEALPRTAIRSSGSKPDGSLADNEERLRLATEQSDVAVWEYDYGTGRIVRSANHDQMYGLPWQDQWDMPTFVNATHPDDRAETQRIMQASMARGGPDEYRFNFRVVHPDSTVRWLAATGRIIERDEHGQGLRLRGVLIDITAAKQSEEALRESESRFRRAVLGAPFPILIHAEDGEVLTVNSPWSELTGYDIADIPTIADWTHKAYGKGSEIVQSEIDALYALDGPKEEGRYSVTTKSGETRIWDFSSAPIGRLPDGRRLVISMAMDVTAREQIDTERRKFFELAESSSEFIGMCDLDMTPLYVNPAGRQMVGLPDMEAACRVKVQDYYFPEDQRFIAEEFFPRVLRDGHGDVEIRLRHFQTGEPIWMYYYLFRVNDAGGTPVGWATVSRDITERRQADFALRRYADRLSNLHRIDLAILQALDSPDTITQEAVLHLRALLQCHRVIVGMFDVDTATAKVFAAHQDTDDVMQFDRAYSEAVLSELSQLQADELQIVNDVAAVDALPAAAQFVHDDGIRAFLNVPLVSTRGVIGVLSVGWENPRITTPDEHEIVSEVASQICIAIEQARLLQETRRHAAELEERVALRTTQLELANQELGAFSHSVSHDLRAPLRHIKGYVDLLTSQHRDALPETAKHYLDEVGDSALQMGALIDDLLAFARTSRQDLQHSEVDMRAAVALVRGRLTTEISDRMIDWSVGDLPTVSGDRAMLEQVWTNLLANAVKYTRGRARAKIQIGATRSPGAWEFFVRDNGVGFDMRYAHKLFGVFQRLHSQADFEGTGIGLASVQRIVRKHGGAVRADGMLNEGATFYFSIPDRLVGGGG